MLIAVCAGAVALGASKLLKRHNDKHDAVVSVPEHREEKVHGRIG